MPGKNKVVHMGAEGLGTVGAAGTPGGWSTLDTDKNPHPNAWGRVVAGVKAHPKQCARAASLAALVVGVALFVFTVLYAAHIFHFETFIGRIGPGVMIPLSATIVVVSAVALAAQFLRNS